MRHSWLLLISGGISTIAGLALANGCGGGASKPAAPSTSTTIVQAVQPVAGATCVPTSTKVQVSFAVAVNSQTVNTSDVQVIDGNKNPVAGAVAFDAANNTATFTPDTPLSANASYTTTVSGVTPSSGPAMSAPFTASFTTGPCSSGQMQYQVSLFSSKAVVGQVSVDTTGVVTAQLNGATPNTTYALNFCPAPAQNYSCFPVSNINTDGSGNANAAFQFPQSGPWTGDFQVMLNGGEQFETDLNPNLTSSVYVATLLPSTTANGKGIELKGATPGPQDPLASGSVSLQSGGNLQFQITGATPNSTYSPGECPTFFGSSCYALYNSQGVGGFTTDASGNVTFTVLWDQLFGDILTIDAPAGRSGFIAGFKVP
jgi:hypothetical protein